MSEKIGTNIGNQIKSIRESKSMTVTELAKRAGVSNVAVWTWEHRGTTPRPGTLEAVAKALDVSTGSLSANSAIRRESARTTRLSSRRSSMLAVREAERLPLEALMRAIDAKGFKVVVEPKKKVA